MHGRFLLSVILLAVISTTHAQLSISLQEPPPGIVQTQQLWNLTLIYNGAAPLEVGIELRLVDISNNQPVLSAFTRPIILTHGVRQMRLTSLSPIEYNYFSTAFSRLSGGFLPVGNYRACYSVYNRAKNTEGVLAEDCIAVDVSPLSPPLLALPADSAILQQPYPQFSWLPPAPQLLFAQLNYDLLLVEVREDQTPNAAIQENLPIYSGGRLTTVFSSYPLSAKKLDTGRQYAWRVIAKDGEMFAAQSDVWTFRIKPDNPDQQIPPSPQYLELQQDQAATATAVISTNELGIKYYSYEKSYEAAIQFFNERGELVKTVRKPIIYGNNFWVFKLPTSFRQDAVYLVEFTDLQQNRHRTSFSISKQ